MINVIFVGEKPSKTNVLSTVPFVGARSFKTLLAWIKLIDPDYYLVYNADDDKKMFEIEALSANGFKVIALGDIASKTLFERGIRHYHMPHPSSKNRKLNDPRQVEQAINLARSYVRI